MKKLLVISTLIVFIFTGCSKSKETESNSNVITNEAQAIQEVSEDDVKTNPELPILTYNDALKLNNEAEQIEGTFGGSPVIWHTIKVDGVEYHYIEDESTNDNSSSNIDQDPVSTTIIGSEYTLNCELKVGMSSDEVLSKYPNLVRTELNEKFEDDNTNTSSLGWNGAAYPENWETQFDYGLMADIDNGKNDDLPQYLVLLIKDEKVAAITFMYPTAN